MSKPHPQSGIDFVSVDVETANASLSTLTLIKADPVMLKIIDPPDAQLFVNII